MEPYQWWWWHGMGLMWIFPVIFLVVCVVFVFTFMSRGPGWFSRHWDRHDGRETARDILDRRYASGEITTQQYEEMKRGLSSK
jgi:putative membrane protein